MPFPTSDPLLARALGKDAGLAMVPPSVGDLLAIARLFPGTVFRCVKDSRGRIVFTLNEGQLAEETHTTTRDVYGKTLPEIVPLEIADQHLPHFEAAFRGDPVEWIFERDGRAFRQVARAIRGSDDAIVAVIGFSIE